MKYKFVMLVLLVSLLVSGSGTAFAQGPQPPDNSNAFASLLKSQFTVPSTSKDSVTNNTIIKGNGILTATTPSIINGDFEQGQYVGWSESSTNGWDLVGDSSYIPLPPHSGNWAVWLGSDYNETAIISQSNISIVTPTNLRLWYQIGSGESCGLDHGYVEINASTIYTWDLCSAYNTSDWVPLDLNLNAYNGQVVTLSIAVVTTASTSSGMLIDDVSLYPTFADVSYDYWAQSYTERLYNAGITGGCGTAPLVYCPEATVTRSQMAVFLLRGIHGSSYNPPAVGTSTGFADVPTNYWAAAWIKQLAAEGITGGCSASPLLYCPEAPVTRAQMAIFLLRSKYGSSYNPPAVGGSTGFGDIPTDYWAAAWIKQLVAEGITSGCGSGNYCPDTPVSRAQMAVFLVRTFNLP